ncbi:helix-turn-helix domain-containing protein [Clostridium beijerinckii]|jgi:AraC-like DNA-binding protein|uniref:AraC family transcriptional regulator n=1 Tax=Clostridium beijerinckii TaxID=1520 RepID=A0AAW3WC71_CLOBE|nr:AraC family transcriptional regulator [Clostridium beijerinckii]MBC2457992.1 AraC family transcriptional regulator [Clostridium beijerinckii]MBC2476467.1 AraC family transcriptional regulator [Clostridium beijerinckii]MCI1478410.1 AraC family transcriptional regulator [Clostridium beijerinckii]MCI1579041.1 AraC family transcriptional regulator [Clostridium beijerinckii]MCI1582892.1 AraC family transcriptional regulator [Clostridium beijerinckii]
MLKEIHDKLIALTDEELRILNGENSVDRSIYTDYDEGEYLYFKASERKKLSKAVELIKLTEYLIIEIIEFVGYENPTYLYKIFKKKFGMTPREYKMNRINNFRFT